MKRLCCKCTTYAYLSEKQLTALCLQLHCLPASNGTHESFIRRRTMSPYINDQEICMRTQTHKKPQQTNDFWADKYSTFLRVATHAHIYWHQGGLVVIDTSFNWRANDIDLCFQSSAKNILEQVICPLVDPCAVWLPVSCSNFPVEEAHIGQQRKKTRSISHALNSGIFSNYVLINIKWSKHLHETFEGLSD